MIPGQVVFFKKSRAGSARKAPEVEYKGHGFGLMLGHVPPFQKDPPLEHILRILGSLGFLTFDDVGEFLGNEAGALVVKKYQEKYYGEATAEAEEAAKPSGLILPEGIDRMPPPETI